MQSGIRVLGLLAIAGAFGACTAETSYVVAPGAEADSGADCDDCIGDDPPIAEEPDEPADAPDAGKRGKDAGKLGDAAKPDARDSGGSPARDSGSPETGAPDTGSPDTGSPDTGAPFVGGTSVGECQGETVLVASFNGVTPQVNSGFAIYSGGQHEVYAYSRATVTDYAYGGQAGETKVRLLLPQVTGPGQYQGMMGVFSWDAAQGKWVNYATPTQTVVVTIAQKSVVLPTGVMCNGWLVGRAEALFSPNNVVVLDFSVPLLTATFPHSKPGPP